MTDKTLAQLAMEKFIELYSSTEYEQETWPEFVAREPKGAEMWETFVAFIATHVAEEIAGTCNARAAKNIEIANDQGDDEEERMALRNIAWRYDNLANEIRAKYCASTEKKS